LFHNAWFNKNIVITLYRAEGSVRLFKGSIRTLMMETESVPKIFVGLNHLTQLSA